MSLQLYWRRAMSNLMVGKVESNLMVGKVEHEDQGVADA